MVGIENNQGYLSGTFRGRHKTFLQTGRGPLRAHRLAFTKYRHCMSFNARVVHAALDCIACIGAAWGVLAMVAAAATLGLERAPPGVTVASGGRCPQSLRGRRLLVGRCLRCLPLLLLLQRSGVSCGTLHAGRGGHLSRRSVTEHRSIRAPQCHRASLCGSSSGCSGCS